MNAPTTQIGKIASPSERVVVERNGEPMVLKQGDAIFAGDLIQNQDIIPVDIEMPAQTTGQADSLITLAPEAAARVSLATAEDGISSVLEVTTMSDGVELYALGDGADGAILMADASSGSFSGLLGSSVLAGAGMGSLATGAAVVGGAAGLAAVAETGGDSNSQTFTTTNAPATSDGSSNQTGGTETEATHNMDSTRPDNTTEPATPDGGAEDQTATPDGGTEEQTATPDGGTEDQTAALDLTNPESVGEFLMSLPEQNPENAPAILEDTLISLTAPLTDALGISSDALTSGDNPLAPITDNIPM